MNNNLKWLISLADGKPLLFSLALLMIALTVMALVVKNRENKIQDYEIKMERLIERCDKKVDSVDAYYRRREIELNSEVKATMNSIIEEYKRELEDQKNFNRQRGSQKYKEE